MSSYGNKFGGGRGGFRSQGYGRGGGFRDRGRGNFRGRGGGGGGGQFGRRFEDMGPPENVSQFGLYKWSCEGDLVIKATINDVPFFNAPVYLEDKQTIGKIDEIFGQLRDYYVSVKLKDEFSHASFKVDDKIFIDPAKILPLQRFLPQPPGTKPRGGGRGRGGGGRGRGGIGGRGRGGGGRGRGGGRGGFGRGGGHFGGGGGGRFSGRGQY